MLLVVIQQDVLMPWLHLISFFDVSLLDSLRFLQVSFHFSHFVPHIVDRIQLLFKNTF